MTVISNNAVIPANTLSPNPAKRPSDKVETMRDARLPGQQVASSANLQAPRVSNKSHLTAEELLQSGLSKAEILKAAGLSKYWDVKQVDALAEIEETALENWPEIINLAEICFNKLSVIDTSPMEIHDFHCLIIGVDHIVPAYKMFERLLGRQIHTKKFMLFLEGIKRDENVEKMALVNNLRKNAFVMIQHFKNLNNEAKGTKSKIVELQEKIYHLLDLEKKQSGNGDKVGYLYGIEPIYYLLVLCITRTAKAFGMSGTSSCEAETQEWMTSMIAFGACDMWKETCQRLARNSVTTHLSERMQTILDLIKRIEDAGMVCPTEWYNANLWHNDSHMQKIIYEFTKVFLEKYPVSPEIASLIDQLFINDDRLLAEKFLAKMREVRTPQFAQNVCDVLRSNSDKELPVIIMMGRVHTKSFKAHVKRITKAGLLPSEAKKTEQA